MIKLIVGNKGSGKTKAMIEKANAAAAASKGNVVCIVKGLLLPYDLSHKVRLIDVTQYGVKGYEAYCGFICGVMAGNYDITDIFCDATLKIGGNDLEAFADMVEKLISLTTANGMEITFTVSCDLSRLPERIKKYVI